MLATIVCLLLLYVCICCAWVLSFPESRRPICLPVLCLAPCWNTTVFVWQCTVRAASVLHDKLFHRLLLSPMRFFDTTPLGRILTRFSRDMDEGEVSCLDFILRALRSPYHPDNTVWSDIFWFSLCPFLSIYPSNHPQWTSVWPCVLRCCSRTWPWCFYAWPWCASYSPGSCSPSCPWKLSSSLSTASPGQAPTNQFRRAGLCWLYVCECACLRVLIKI